jgi:hypothetical protein
VSGKRCVGSGYTEGCVCVGTERTDMFLTFFLGDVSETAVYLGRDV